MTNFKLHIVHIAWLLTKYPFTVNGQGNSKLVIRESYLCKDVPVQQVKFILQPKDYNPGLQYVYINVTTPYPVGNDITIKTSFEFNEELIAANSWTHLGDIEDNMCKALSTYLGDFWNDILVALGVMSGSCPIPRGSYHAVGYRMNLQKLRLQTFPFGNTRVRLELHHKIRNELVGCIVFVVFNKF